MRVSTSLIHQLGISAILDRQSELSKTQLQLSTGQKYLSPADNPAAAARVLNLDQALSVVNQYQTNIDLAEGRVGLEEVSLEGVGNILHRVRELAIQGNNKTASSANLIAISSELRELLDEMLNIANTRDSNGEYIFAGFQGKTQPFSQDASGNFVYSGDQGQRFVQIGANRRVAIGDSGSETFQMVRNGNGTFTTLDNAANNGNGIIDPGSVIDPAAYDGDSYLVLFPIQTAAGATLTFNDANANDALTYTLEINGTAVYSVNDNLSATAPTTLADLAAVINDDTSTTSVKAYVAGGQLYLGSTSPSALPITVTERISGATDGDADTITGYFGSALTGTTTTSNNVVYNNGDAQFYVVEDSMGNVETSGTYVDSGQISFNGIKTSVKGVPQNNDSFSITPSANQDIFTILGDLINVFEGQGTQLDIPNAVNRTLADLNLALDHVLETRARTGSRLNSIDNQRGINESLTIDLESTLSKTQDLDYASAVSQYQQDLLALQAAQQSFTQIQGLSLFNYL